MAYCSIFFFSLNVYFKLAQSIMINTYTFYKITYNTNIYIYICVVNRVYSKKEKSFREKKLFPKIFTFFRISFACEKCENFRSFSRNVSFAENPSRKA